MDSASIRVFTSSFAYNFDRKRITIFGMWYVEVDILQFKLFFI